MSPHIRYRRARGAVALAPLAAAMTLCFSANGYAATIFVNSASDVSVSGKCTLLDAVAAVNGLAAVNACAAGNGNNDTIDLSFFSIPTAITFALASSADGKSALALSRAATIRGNLDSGGTPLVKIARSSVSRSWAPFLDNGGPTLTRSLPNGSCAINNGPGNAPANIHTDQRGAKFLRKFGAATDIGAYEAQPNERIFYDGFESGP